MACFAALVTFGSGLFLADICRGLRGAITRLKRDGEAVHFNQDTREYDYVESTDDMALSATFVARLRLRLLGAITRKMTFEATYNVTHI
jgi:hypothetical protein